ncbi:MAG TPA: helix-turn-helix transcriptional regulator [Acidobacteriota bacterium]|nr:helix-turn-helix transcriptional regulator [Acidobacteriota bacterium]
MPAEESKESKPDEPLLGSFEELVLLAVAHLGGRAYGMQVRREIERRSGRSTAIGAVYATLDRMEDKSYLASCLAETAKERRGRARKYYALQPQGAQVLLRAQKLRRQMWGELDLAALRDTAEAES